MAILYLLYLLFSLLFSASAYSFSQTQASVKTRYSQAHILPDSYVFDPRDGWFSNNVTDLPSHAQIGNFSSRDDKNQKNAKGVAASVSSLVNDRLKGLGLLLPVIITWYTGFDLLNPSCWSKIAWAPTDHSFVCAVTQDGWEGRPQCFEFLEVCSSVKRCIFVRVVDTCAGCARGSQHLDLTKGAFAQLADLNEGKLKVHYRPATKPGKYWSVDLWGPKN